MEIHIEKSNHIERSYLKTIQEMDLSCRDLEELTKFDVVSKIKQQGDKLSGDDSCCVLVVKKIFGTSINFETTTKFKLVEDSM